MTISRLQIHSHTLSSPVLPKLYGAETSDDATDDEQEIVHPEEKWELGAASELWLDLQKKTSK